MTNVREIKFRAWVEYYDEPRMVYLNREDLVFDYEDGFVTAFTTEAEFYSFEAYPKRDAKMTLMQYTGLKDKNGNEIYEGDIVKYEGEIRVVAWDNLGFVLQFPNTRAFAWDLWHAELSEIIGNIYESPDLLPLKDTEV